MPAPVVRQTSCQARKRLLLCGLTRLNVAELLLDFLFFFSGQFGRPIGRRGTTAGSTQSQDEQQGAKSSHRFNLFYQAKWTTGQSGSV
jgi:hypothetical protein